MKLYFRIPLAATLLLFASLASAQHLADPEYKPVVEHPAYAKNGPRVLFDEGHNNYHTSTNRYRPFADLLTLDGYRIVINRQPFTKKVLESFKVLVIVNALADDIDEAGADGPAFTEEEVGVIRDWVDGGGALLLIAEQAPFGKSAASLAKRFEIEMSGGMVEDPANSEKHKDYLVFSRDNHLLTEHPILEGRDNAEKVNRVIAFSGQSLKGPKGSTAFLTLSDKAVDNMVESTDASKSVSAAGRAEGLALKVGNGRVVVLGEADMLSALLDSPPANEPIGMNYPGIDNKQLTLNIMHWLSGLIR
jgi:hypothetical protein